MPARLDKPLRLTGAVKTATAQFLGRTIVAIAPDNEPWLDACRRRIARRQGVAR
jgi:hypothetical protein